MIFNLSGGGGTALNFRVVGGTSTPSDPKENTIWVNTNTTITDWVFSADEPSTWKLCSAAGEILGSIDGYTLTKKNNGNAVFAFASNGDYAIPMLISDNRNAAIIRRSDGTTIDAGTTYSYNGKTYYLTFPGYNLNSFGTLVPKYTDSEDPYKAIEFLVDKLLAQKQAEGIVWFQTGTTSPAAFNALKKNGILVYPISAKQYVNGAWADKTAKTYQGGAWVDWWNGELFDNGNQYDGITGGWVQGQYQVYGSENASGGSFTVGNNIDLTASGGQSCVSVRTVNKIDLTRFNTVTATFTGNGYVFAASATSGIPVVLGTSGANSIDVSALSGEYYVGVMARNYQEMHVSKINLQ